MAEGGADLASYHGFEDVIPQELKDQTEQAKEDILAGNLEVPVRYELSK